MAEEGRELYSWEKRALATAHRQVEIGAGGGYCRWCGKAILGKRGKYIGRPDPARSWCRDPDGSSACLREWNLHRVSAVQFNWLEANRGLRCAWCRECPVRWRNLGVGMSLDPEARPPPMPWEGERKGEDYIEALTSFYARRREAFPFWGYVSLVEQVTDLCVDHILPLWLVAIIVPREDRRPYFGPDNLQMLCGRCHGIKTAREAGERAHMKAFAKAQLRFDFI